MCGCLGGSGAKTGDGVDGLPMNAGSELGPSGMGCAANAPGAPAKARVAVAAISAAASKRRIRMREGCPLARCATRLEQVGASRVAEHLLVARERILHERHEPEDLRDWALRRDVAAGESRRDVDL